MHMQMPPLPQAGPPTRPGGRLHPVPPRRRQAGEAREHRCQGISYRTACRWRRARKLHGPAGLEPRSTRPVRKRKKNWGRREARAVVALRRRHPFTGARPLRVLLAGEGTALSQGAVGRIVRALPQAPHDPSGRLAARTRRTQEKAGLLRRPRPALEVRRQGAEPGRTRRRRPAGRAPALDSLPLLPLSTCARPASTLPCSNPRR